MIPQTKSFYCFLYIFTVLGVLFFNSCKHKTNFEELHEVSYKNDVAPIISSNCAFSGCHGADTLKPKFTLTSYENIVAHGIIAGNPSGSKLYNRITTLDENKMMPKRPYSALTENKFKLFMFGLDKEQKIISY